MILVYHVGPYLKMHLYVCDSIQPYATYLYVFDPIYIFSIGFYTCVKNASCRK